MEQYNYREAVYKDCFNFIKGMFCVQDYEADEYYKYSLMNDAFLDSSVTGNETGAYWDSAWEAEEAICHNLDLYVEAINAFGNSVFENFCSAKAMDVTIRCYLLDECFCRAFDDYLKLIGYTL